MNNGCTSEWEEGNQGRHLNTLMHTGCQRCGLSFLIGGISKKSYFHLLLIELNWRKGDVMHQVGL